jgi:two-component system sensor histidine kinase/response regulator
VSARDKHMAWEIERILEELGLDREVHPDPSQWRALVERLADERIDREIHRRERFLEAVVEMQTRLLSTVGDHLGAYNHALAPLGEATGAARVYLFENHRRPGDGALLVSQRAEWCAPGISPEIDNPALQGLAYDDFVPGWYTALSRGAQVERLADEYDELEAALLVPQGVLSLLVLPLQVDGELTGFIGFDNCTSQRRWSPLEVSLLGAAATQIGLLLAQRRAEWALREVHAEVERARDRALDASRAKSAFLARMSHELRTPLNAILGFAELVLESPAETPRQELDLDVERIVGASRHLLAIIDDLLDVARIEADRLQIRSAPIDLRELLDDLAANARNLASRHHNSFTLVLPADLGLLVSDRTRLHQILLNLLSNACKYTIEGRVTLRVELEPGSIAFIVSDTGIGIPADQLERIFEAFAQVDESTTRAYEGTGLGLTISRRLSRLLGGSLSVSSTEQQGSTFTLRLPRSA